MSEPVGMRCASSSTTGSATASDRRRADGRRRFVRDLRGASGGASAGSCGARPSHASSATAHDVLREFRILDAIKDEPVPIARPVLACDDPAVFGAPFYVMDRIDGVPVRSGIPQAWTATPEPQAAGARPARRRARRDPRGRLGALRSRRPGAPRPYLERQIGRWLSQLESYGGRATARGRTASPSGWTTHRPADQPASARHGDYKLDNVLFAESAPPDLLAVVDWEMASIGDPLIDLAWAMIFHPGPEGTMPLGVATEPAFDRSRTARPRVADRRATRSGPGATSPRIDWYDVFARWKLAIVLEGSYAKFLRGESKKPDPRVLRPAGRPAARERHEHRRGALMAKPNDLELDADEIVEAAIVILPRAWSRRGEHAERRRPSRRVADAPVHAGGEQGGPDRRGRRSAPRRSRARCRHRRTVAGVRRAVVPGAAEPAQAGLRQQAVPRRRARGLRGGIPPVDRGDASRRPVGRRRGAGLPPAHVGDRRLRGHGAGIEPARRRAPVAAACPGATPPG